MSDAPQKFRIFPVVLALIAGLALGGAGVMLYMKHQSAGMPKTEAPLPAARALALYGHGSRAEICR